MIFIGSVFQVVLMIAVIVGTTRRDLVEAAYTLGAGARDRTARDVAQRRAPDRRDPAHGARLGLDLRDRGGAHRRASGIGHMIMDSQGLLATDQISSASSDRSHRPGLRLRFNGRTEAVPVGTVGPIDIRWATILEITMGSPRLFPGANGG